MPDRSAASHSSTLHDSQFRLGQHLGHPHLPQGAPTSPALANLSAYRLDLRLAGLAESAGIVYSRYADDLALSSSAFLGRAQVERLVQLVERIAGEEGPTALLTNSERAVRLFGRPMIDLATMIDWVADWVARDRPNLNKPTHFEVRDGVY